MRLSGPISQLAFNLGLQWVWNKEVRGAWGLMALGRAWFNPRKSFPPRTGVALNIGGLGIKHTVTSWGTGFNRCSGHAVHCGSMDLSTVHTINEKWVDWMTSFQSFPLCFYLFQEFLWRNTGIFILMFCRCHFQYSSVSFSTLCQYACAKVLGIFPSCVHTSVNLHSSVVKRISIYQNAATVWTIMHDFRLMSSEVKRKNWQASKDQTAEGNLVILRLSIFCLLVLACSVSTGGCWWYSWR